jgi:anti-sigma regulatory factor (Ser/Thr protein kinase)
VRNASVVVVPCTPSSVAVTRGQISADLRDAAMGTAAISDAALVLSELMSNAILHARPLSGSQLTVSWVLAAGSLEIAVSDGGSVTRPRAADPPVSSLGGRGLGIVAHLCSSWGVRTDAACTTVWAVLPVASHGAAPDVAGSPVGALAESAAAGGSTAMNRSRGH